MIQINQPQFASEISGSDSRLRCVEGAESSLFEKSLEQARENDRQESTSAAHTVPDLTMMNVGELAGQVTLADRAAAEMAGSKDAAEEASTQQGTSSELEPKSKRAKVEDESVSAKHSSGDATSEADESEHSRAESRTAIGRTGAGSEGEAQHASQTSARVEMNPKSSAVTQSNHSQGGTSDVAGNSGVVAQTASAKGVTSGSKPEGVSSIASMTSFRDAMSRVGAKAGSPQILRAETQVAAQASRIMVQGLREGKTEVVMRLCPEALGPVKIELSLDEGRVSAKLHAEHDAARELLSAGLDHLRCTLEARGLNVDRLEVVTPAEPGEHGLTSGGFDGADRHGASKDRDAAGGDAGRGSGVDDGAATESRIVEPAAESAGMWWERGTDGLALLRLDAVV